MEGRKTTEFTEKERSKLKERERTEFTEKQRSKLK